METNYIVLHCSATRADQNITTDDIRSWHVNDNGWSDIGYHWVIEWDGAVQKAHDARIFTN